MQEVITLTVFAIFSTTYLKKPPTFQHFAGIALLIAGGAPVFIAR